MRGITFAAVSLLSLVAAHYGDIPLGYNTVLFSEDFSGPTLDTSTWTYDIGTSYPGGPPQWGTWETQTYTSSSSNIFVADDVLTIVPRNENGTWTSARIETTAAHDFSCPEGGKLLVRGRIKLGDNPALTQAGIWPAFWMLGSAYRGVYTNWPSVGELDILESPNGEQRTWHTAHCGEGEGGPCNEPNGLGNTVALLRAQWNILSVEIDRSSWPERITWFVNHFPTFTLTEADVGDEDSWRALSADPKMVLLNVAVGGALPDGIAGKPTPDENTQGGEGAAMQVDYISVYST